jgi:type I restriction enzyme S subunit
VGKVCWVPELPWPTVPGGFISALRPLAGRVHDRYLYWWAASPRAQAAIRKCANQTTNIANLSIPRLLKVGVPLPPLDEQGRIAAILDQADTLRRKRQETIAGLEHLSKHLFVSWFQEAADAFTWPKVTIGELAASTQYGTSAKAGSEGTYPILRMGNITLRGWLGLGRPEVHRLGSFGSR